ncbi:MAG: hypothetical protein KKH98_13400 [Spirochaetes bacterium]|nr:hypothetical protein [Spirochaetota bacterium]
MKKNILLGISGGIAAYKCCELVRTLVKKGFQVKVVMTEHAKEFVSPLTFRTLSGHPVFSDMFGENLSSAMPHISLSKESDIMVVAPATANIIAKTVHGFADDLLSTLILSFKGKVLFAPAMNSNMYNNPIFQENLKLLKKYDKKYKIIGPEKGDLACGDEGIGRMSEVDTIIKALQNEIK